MTKAFLVCWKILAGIDTRAQGGIKVLQILSYKLSMPFEAESVKFSL